MAGKQPVSGISFFKTRFLLMSLALISGLFLLPASHAFAQSSSPGTLQATLEKGYARLIFRSETRPDAAAVVSNGVLIVQFASSVTVDLDAIPAILPSYITAAKRDPDGTALRFALAQKLTANVMPLGDALYIDLLPQGWRGFPPPLPAEALTEATLKSRRLAAAEVELERMRSLPHKPLQVSTGTHPTFYRLAFTPDKPVNVSYDRKGTRVSVRFNANITVDSTPLRALIPDALTNLDVVKTASALTINFDVPETNSVRYFEDEGGIILDVQRPDPASSIAPAGTPEPSPELTIEQRPRNNRNSQPPTLPAMPQFPKQDPAPRSSESKPDHIAPRAAFAPSRAGGLLHFASSQHTSILPLIRTTSQPKPVSMAQAAPQNSPAVPAMRPVVTTQNSDMLSIHFPQANAQMNAAFMRGNVAWLVLDGTAPFPTDGLMEASGGLIREIRMVKTTNGMALALALNETRALALTRTDNGWDFSLSKDTLPAPPSVIRLSSGFTDKGLSFLQANIPNAGPIQRISDPFVGDTLVVFTTGLPVKGIFQNRDLLELNILSTAQGLVFQPKADDLAFQSNNQGIMVTRPDGLSLSVFTEHAAEAASSTPEARANPFTNPVWQMPVTGLAYQQDESLLREMANATSAATRTTARIKMANALLAHGETADAKAVLDIIRADSPGTLLDPETQLLYASTLTLMRRYPEAIQALRSTAVENNPIASLWRGVAEYRQGNNGDARDNFAKGQEALATLPDRLQKIVLETMVESALDAKDPAAASSGLEALRILPMAENDANVLLLRAQVAQATGKPEVALELYDQVMVSRDEMSAAKAQLYATKLRLVRKAVDDDTAIRELESLATRWRGDAVEAETLAQLAQLYTRHERWREALEAMRTAMLVQPDKENSRVIHTTMSELFANLFSGDSEQSAPATLDSVALFYDFRDLVPPGPTGDVMIRQLVDRLTEVDLLTPAASLLEYQINNRLSGAARSQVAAQAAMLHIMNHNPSAAYAIIQDTRQANLPADLVRNRFILEARALSEMGRTDLSLDMINGYEGQDVVQLRADILWHSERWQQAAEAFELTVGERWKEAANLDDLARKNVMRAAIAYVRANDQLGLERLRTRYLSKMAETTDARAFDVVTAPVITPSQGEAFRDVVRAVAAVDSLNSFLEEYKKLHPTPEPDAPLPQPAGSASPITDSPVKES